MYTRYEYGEVHDADCNFTGCRLAVDPASALACPQQGQWCFGPADSQSARTPLTGDQDQRPLMKTLGNTDDYQRARWIHNVITKI